jgi:hypothetical protein
VERGKLKNGGKTHFSSMLDHLQSCGALTTRDELKKCSCSYDNVPY